ncbi:MAG: PD40 domain-containing protein [Saprospiraceae bacterium]|uniref:PD40 domain-containing protein n=1 Tax=Candidatus Opimibacter skivensis TaxID=2982028 RepID=A0A9D7XUB0_9BACT|nr:PD40 domain-containing protein [Candidatus Opimibacter skivensis]
MACQPKNDVVSQSSSLSLESATDNTQVFAEGIVSTRYNERDMAISSAGDELFFSLGNYNQSKRVIVHLRKKNDVWNTPEVMSWSGVYNDIEPCLAADGGSIFFASDRPVDGDSTRKDFNIWVSQREGDLWKEPVPLDTLINSKVDEFYPSTGKNGNLYFTAAHPGNHGREDIYIAAMKEGKYTAPVSLDTAINSTMYEFNAYVSPGEDTIIFSSYGRKDDMGGGDLYMSTKDKGGVWQMAHNLGPKINSPSLDYCPFIDSPRKTFYFTSNRSIVPHVQIKNADQLKSEADKTLNGLDNIYHVKLSALR